LRSRFLGEPNNNLFVVADIEKYGFDFFSQDILAYTNELEELKSIITVFKRYCIYGYGEIFWVDNILALVKS